jgi:GT2 family glycosyltransferase
MVVSARCDAAVGPWDESYFLYSEEVDFAWRVRQAGYPIDFVPAARAMHEEGGSGRVDVLVPLRGLNKLRYYRARHSRAASAVYAAGLLVHLLARAWDTEHRRAIRPLAPAMWQAVTRGHFADLVGT